MADTCTEQGRVIAAASRIAAIHLIDVPTVDSGSRLGLLLVDVAGTPYAYLTSLTINDDSFTVRIAESLSSFLSVPLMRIASGTSDSGAK